MSAAFDARLTLAPALKQLVERSLESMAVYDQDLRYCAVSPALLQQLAGARQVCIGQTNADLAALAQPRCQSDSWREYWQQVDDAPQAVRQQAVAERRVHFLPVGQTRQRE